jgi:hypothetical protein
MRRRIGTSLYAGFLFTVLGFVAWVSGQPFIFPSLGPSAFLLAFERHSDWQRTYGIVGSHLIGGIAGLLAFTILGNSAVVVGSPPALSADGLRLVASASLSLILTSWGMIATDTIHAPACATTLIVSLGVLSTPTQVAIIIVSVVLLVGSHTAVLVVFKRLVGQTHPVSSEE